MKKVFFKSMMGVALVGMAMSSCVEVEDKFDPQYVAKLAEYRAQWVENFGEIDPNEDWGFGTGESSKTKALTRGANTNSNQWGDYVIVPASISDAEISAVLKVFNAPIDKSASKRVNWSDFWVQHVYQGNNSYTTEPDMNGHRQELQNVKIDKMQTAYYSENGELVYDHVNNFNASLGQIMLMQNSGTVDFFYCNPQDGGNIYSDYVVMEIDGQYYVGFDYSCNNSNTFVKADGIYNDWIVKISPAEYKSAKRIICEDLGSIGDFDFNDVVFDASIIEDWSTGSRSYNAIITVHAAGGTLPVFIGGVDVHKAFGVADDVMVNTGVGVSCPPAIFRIPVSNADLCDIEVLVKMDNAVCVLKAPKGDAPQKICVTTDFVWPDERVNIKELYPDFPNANWAGSATDEEVK